MWVKVLPAKMTPTWMPRLFQCLTASCLRQINCWTETTWKLSLINDSRVPHKWYCIKLILCAKQTTNSCIKSYEFTQYFSFRFVILTSTNIEQVIQLFRNQPFWCEYTCSGWTEYNSKTQHHHHFVHCKKICEQTCCPKAQCETMNYS